jgi:uncharacterized cupredoxin-like copper-binding protein
MPRHPLFLALLLVAACGRPEDQYGAPGSGYVEDQAAHTAAADWSQAEAVTVALDEYAFAPEALTFLAGRPYALTLVNDGDAGHTFTAPGFFRAIAVRSLATAEGKKPAPLLESIAVEAGRSRTLEFVPLRAGTYELQCDRPLHDVFGMTGSIRIE